MVLNKKGFTLIETIISIGIATAVITAPMSVIARHLIENSITKNSIRGRLYAQEVVEYSRYLRDNTFLLCSAENNSSMCLDSSGNRPWFGTTLAKCDKKLCYTSSSGKFISGFHTNIPFNNSTVSIDNFCTTDILKNIVGTQINNIDSFFTYDGNNQNQQGYAFVKEAEYVLLLMVDSNVSEVASDADIPPQARIHGCVVWRDTNKREHGFDYVSLQEILYKWVITDEIER